MSSESGTLYVIATPIGNMGDITDRAREALESADIVAAEDTRRARQLLTRLGLTAHLVSLHEHNEAARVDPLVEALQSGKRVALISDAGTPLISDPGYRLVTAARDAGLPVSPIPGCCAAIAALSVAGLPADRFCFEGFLPARQKARRERLARLRDGTGTLIFYEAVHRIGAMLEDLEASFGPDRPVFVARELTKLHETFYRGRLADVRARLAADPGAERGEFVIVVGGAEEAPAPARAELERVVGILLTRLPAGQAATLAARITGAERSEAYDIARLLRRDA